MVAFATGSASTKTASEAPKTKTKAKQRYLRRKKERRKARKHLNSLVTSTSHSLYQDAIEDSECADEPEHGSIQSELESDDNSNHSAVQDSHFGHSEADKRKDQAVKGSQMKRAGKRRRSRDLDEDVDMIDVEQLESAASENHVSLSPTAKASTPVSTLPSFPLPSVPDPPPKSVLALQGLDQALLDAEVVDPGATLPVSLEDQDTATGLSLKTRKRLKELGIDEYFAVQTKLLPFLLPSNPLQRSLYQPYDPPRDVCVSAPTGSGKTLAYVLPIIEILSSRIVTRLRALIVLPTRDLVMQVRETFETVGKGRGLKVGIATGQHSFTQEQTKLIADKSPYLKGGSSKVDILICTPGRLSDHLTGTPNFSLQHLRFLVIDEADRLLAQSFQDWLAQVLAAIRPPTQITESDGLISSDDDDIARPPTRPYADALAPAFMPLSSPYSEKRETSCQKLLFSATLTRDPGKIAALDLRNPKYFVVQAKNTSSEDNEAAIAFGTEKFTMPFTLTEYMTVCEPSQKPLVLFHLVHSHGVRNALVFTKSAESTTRLVRLFDFFEQARTRDLVNTENTPLSIQAYSSDLPVGERKSILDKFKAQAIQILVCSDLISRGIDISHVSHVVSYDAPVDMRKYVHRAGRTARAGRAGIAWVLVESQEARYFKAMLRSADHLEKVKRVKLSEKDLTPLLHHYQMALNQLQEVYAK